MAHYNHNLSLFSHKQTHSIPEQYEYAWVWAAWIDTAPNDALTAPGDNKSDLHNMRKDFNQLKAPFAPLKRHSRRLGAILAVQAPFSPFRRHSCRLGAILAV